MSLTPKEQMVLDYMRGNGGQLNPQGWTHLVGRGSFRTNSGLAQVVARLERRGLLDAAKPPITFWITRAGVRASEASHAR